MCVCGECPARMSGDQRDSGNLKTSMFLHPDSSEDQRNIVFPRYNHLYGNLIESILNQI